MGVVRDPQSLAFGLSPRGLACGGILLVLLFGTAPFVYFPTWTVRFAAVVVGGLVGASTLVRLVIARDRAAIAAAAFVAFAGTSAMFGSEPLLSALGAAGSDTSVLIYAAVLSLWAAGHSLSARDRTALVSVLVAGVAANVLFGVVQLVFDIRGGLFNSFPGRASGMLANPAYLASVVTGASALAFVRAGRTRSALAYSILWVMTLGVGITGSRAAFMVLVVVGIVASLLKWSAGVLASLAVGCGGVLAGWMLTSWRGSTTVQRAAGKGADGRLEIWRYGLAAWRERPILGWGLGRHSEAVQGRFSESFTRTSAFDDLIQPWDDPHNIVVLVLVSTGLLGLLAAAAFAWCAIASCRDDALVAMVLATGATWLVQPASIHSFPLIMLALGLAAANDEELLARRRAYGTAMTFAVSIASFAVIFVPSVMLRSAIIAGEPENAAAAAGWYWPEPRTADAVADAFTDAANNRPDYEARAVEWSSRAISRDNTRPSLLWSAAMRDLLFKRYDEASRRVDRALELQPWNPNAQRTRLLWATLTGNESERADAAEVLCRVLPPSCASVSDNAGEGQ